MYQLQEMQELGKLMMFRFQNNITFNNKIKMKKVLQYVVCFFALGTVNAQYFSDDFEGGALDGNNAWTVVDVVNGTSGDVWYYDNFSGDNFAEASGYDGAATTSESWLITPSINLTSSTNPVLTFRSSANYLGANIEVYVSTTYSGGAISMGDWTELTGFSISTGTSFDEVASGDIDLSSYKTGSTYIAYRYQSDGVDAANWQIDDVLVDEPSAGFCDNTLFCDDFENGSLIGNNAWTVVDVVNGTSGDVWYYDNFSGDNFAEASGYDGAATTSESWLITPVINLSSATSPMLSFQSSANFLGLNIELYVSTVYSGGAISMGDWTELTGFSLSTGSSFDEVASGNIDLSSYTNATTYIAFRYQSNLTDGAANWQIDDVKIVESTPSSPTTAIKDIQATTGGDASDLVGTNVTTGGIVSGISASGFYIQDNPGAWNGIYVYDPADVAGSIAIGDSVTLSGDVAEWDFSGSSSESTTQLTNISNFNNVGAYTAHAATSLSTLNVNDEMYESVLVSVSNASVVSGPDTFKEWVINDGSGNVNVDDFMYEATPTPLPTEQYMVTGPVSHNFGAYKIVPRFAADVVKTKNVGIDENSTSNIEVYPNPSNGLINIVNTNNNYVEVYNVLGEMIEKTTESRIELTSGLYIIKVGDFSQKVIIK